MSTNELAATGFGLRWNLPLLDSGLRIGGRMAALSLRRLLRRIRVGSLELQFPDGTRQVFRGTVDEGPAARVRINDFAALSRLILKGDIGFAEAYVEGHWETPDLMAFMTLVKLNETHWQRELEGGRLSRVANRLYHRLRDNDRRGSRRNIAYHYDLGNDFYGRWLDPTMTYSSGIFAGGSTDLEAAQREKYRRICELADIRPGSTVLEVGCGWGGFLEHAATLGSTVTGITLSREQLKYAADRLADGGLAQRAGALLQDYRDTAGRYDAVVSIEMLEAVGESHWPTYFETLRERLKPGAAAVVQVITIDDGQFEIYRRRTDFIQRHIFPGGMLPSPSRLREESAAAGLVIDHQETFGPSYATTLALWRERFHRAWPELVELGFDERFRRLWEYYLCYCETGFRDGVIDVGIYRFRRPA